MINTQLVESLAQVIKSLSWEERFLLEEKLFWESAEISSQEIAMASNACCQSAIQNNHSNCQTASATQADV